MDMGTGRVRRNKKPTKVITAWIKSQGMECMNGEMVYAIKAALNRTTEMAMDNYLMEMK